MCTLNLNNWIIQCNKDSSVQYKVYPELWNPYTDMKTLM